MNALLALTRPGRSGALGGAALWIVRAAAVLGLIACAAAGVQHWAQKRSILSCVPDGSACLGQRLQSTRFLHAVRPVAGGWVLDVEGHTLESSGALAGVVPGDLLEATLTFTGPRRVEVHEFVVLRPWRLRLRVMVSMLISLVVLVLVLRRWRRRRRAFSA